MTIRIPELQIMVPLKSMPRCRNSIRPRARLAVVGAVALLLVPVLQLAPASPAVAQEANGNGPILAQAEALLAQGDVRGAQRLFSQALRKDPNSTAALTGMGRAMMEIPAGGGRALRHLTKAVRLAPDDPDAHYYKALAHIHMSDSDIGRDNANLGLRELERVLELNPSHADANFQKGRLLREVYRNAGDAIAAFLLQLDANPEHGEARQHLLEMQVITGNWYGAVSAGEAILARNPEASEAYPYLAAAQWYLGRPTDALQTFERYFDVLDEEEKTLYFDLGYVLTPDEQSDFEALDDDGRRHYRDRYWAKRDPDPRTAENERLLEHYVRVAYSRIEFGQRKWPWDDRGMFYVRYGEPDLRIGWGQPYAEDLVEDPIFSGRRRDFEEELGLPRNAVGGAENARAWAARTPERWVYFDRGIDLHFTDPVMNGRFSVAGDRTRLMVERMEEKLPTISVEEEQIARINPLESVVTFRAAEGRTAIEYAFALLPEEFGVFRSPTGVYAELDIGVQLYTPDWKPVVGASETDRRVETVPQIQVRGIPLFVDTTRLEANPGSYLLATMLLDPGTGARATVEEAIEVPDYSGTELMVSDILPAAGIREVGPGRIGRFIRGELEVLPLPGASLQADQSLFVYYEIYNLTKDDIGATDYQVRYAVYEVVEETGLTQRLFRGIRNLFRRGDALAGLSSVIEATGIRSDVPSHIELDMRLAPPGAYELQLVVTDRLTGSTSSSALRFRTLPGR